MKYLIVNVDDLGGSRGVNRGILETLLSRGAVTGCSPGRRPGEVYAFDCCRSCGLKRIPLLGKGGVDAPSRNIPVPLKGADGVVRSNSKTILLNEPPRLRPLRWLRDIFLKAQPPLLCQGGEFRFTPQLRQQSNGPTGLHTVAAPRLRSDALRASFWTARV